MAQHRGPSLLVAMDDLDRSAKHIRHFLLGLVEFLVDVREFFTVHRCLQEGFV